MQVLSIDSDMKHYQQRLSTSSRSDHFRPLFLFLLAVMQLRRHTLSNQREDLDSVIVHLTESILLPTLSWLQHAREHGPLILNALFYLARALLLRSEVTKQPEDIISATKFLFHLRDQPHEIPIIPRHQVTDLLVQTLALQVKLETRNVMQNIGDIAILSRELLTLEASDIDTTGLIDFIWKVAISKKKSSTCSGSTAG